MTIEAKYGIPTVAMHTDKFDMVVESVAKVSGMPGLRQVFVPQPIMGKTAQQLRAYIDGKDPITGRPVMQEVVEGLTRPLDAAARPRRHGGAPGAALPRESLDRRLADRAADRSARDRDAGGDEAEAR